MATTATQYATAVLGFIDALKEMIETNSPDSDINTRYISSDGNNNEQWIAHLRNEDGVVDRWMITVMGMTGVNQDDESPDQGPIGGAYKPIKFVVDYFADYSQGLDAVGAVGAETVTNTEREFLKKLFAVDLGLEKSRRCLHNGFEIIDWTFAIKIRRFDTASAHWASGVLNTRYTGLIL